MGALFFLKSILLEKKDICSDAFHYLQYVGVQFIYQSVISLELISTK
jgi:hypothetical protein